MNKISVPIKLILIAVLFSVAGLYTVSQLRGQVEDLRIQRDREERVGMDVLLPAYQLQTMLVEKRSALANGTSTDSIDSKISSLTAEVDAAQSRFNQTLVTSTDKASMAGAWDKVASAVSSTSSQAAADDAIGALAKYQELVGDISDLILDPELDSYWLMSGLVVTLPKLGDQIGRVELASQRFLADKKEGTKDALLTEVAKLEVYESDIKAAITAAVKYTEQLNNDIKTDDNITTDTALEETLSQVRSRARAGTTVSALSLEALRQTDSVFDEMTKSINQLIKKRIEKNEGVSTNLLLGAIVVFGLLALLSFFIGRDITSALGRAVDSANAFGNGDLRESISHSRGDELGSLLTSLEVMRTSFREQIESLQGASDTNLSSAGRIQTTASQVAATSAEMATTIAQASATVEEVRQTALLSEQKAKAMASVAQEAAKIAASGNKTTQATAAEMENVQATMDSIAESILQLSNQSKAISNIIASVNDLAEQSNVLAVNASIEAAKAGEFGRGFAVVAQEVKGLADESKQATLQVRGILQEIERSTAAAVMVAEQGSKATTSALSQAKEAGTSIKELGMKVVQAAQSANQISMSSAQQLTGMEQVVEAMVGVKDTSSQMVPSMNELSDSAGQLSGMADELKQSTAKFQL